MKLTSILLIGIALCGSAVAQNIYHLPNPGFEQWDGDDESEPTHWNTFSTSDGSFASLASTNHHYRVDGHRPGGVGNYFLTIYTKSIVGVKANGNMTTGRIHAGSMSATSSENYNYTQRSNSSHCQPFTGTPDSMYVWVSFYAASESSQAQMTAIIHGDSDYKSPNEDGNPSKYKGMAIARTGRTTANASQLQWKQMRVPFRYVGSSEARYMLFNITTNYLPGQGDANDALSVDDIEFIYSAWLTDIKVGGASIAGFDKARMSYAVHVDDIHTLSPSDITYSTEVSDATVEVEVMQPDCDSARDVVLTVTAEDGTTQKRYSIRATTGYPVAVEAAEERPFKVYPNPASDMVTIEGEGKIEIVDMAGRTAATTECHGTVQIDMSAMPRGMYYIKDSKTKIVKM